MQREADMHSFIVNRRVPMPITVTRCAFYPLVIPVLLLFLATAIAAAVVGSTGGANVVGPLDAHTLKRTPVTLVPLGAPRAIGAPTEAVVTRAASHRGIGVVRAYVGPVYLFGSGVRRGVQQRRGLPLAEGTAVPSAAVVLRAR